MAGRFLLAESEPPSLPETVLPWPLFETIKRQRGKLRQLLCFARLQIQALKLRFSTKRLLEKNHLKDIR